MAKLLRIGIVGCGAIGGSLARTIISNFANQAILTSVYDINKNKAVHLANKFKVKFS